MMEHRFADGFILLGIIFFALPFLLSAAIAWIRCRSILMSLLFTVVFSWIVPFALFLLPGRNENSSVGGE